MNEVIPWEPVYEVRCSVRGCDWQMTVNVPDLLADWWDAHRAGHIAAKRERVAA